MDPNSRNQIWSLWEFTVTPGVKKHRPLAQVKLNCSRFGRQEFGSATQMKIERPVSGDWVIKIRSERHPVHDPRFVKIMEGRWRQFFILGFGVGTIVALKTKLEAGSRDDGTPADQLIIMPPFTIGVIDHGSNP